MAIERQERAAPHAVRDLDLGEHDERQDDRRRDARADERVEPIEAKRGRGADCDPAVKADDGRRADERAEPEREPDLVRFRENVFTSMLFAMSAATKRGVFGRRGRRGMTIFVSIDQSADARALERRSAKLLNLNGEADAFLAHLAEERDR